MRRLALLAAAMVAATVAGMVGVLPAGAETVQDRFKSGVEALQAGRAGEAAGTFRDLYERFGVTSPDLLVDLGAAEYEAGEPGRALFHLHRAVRIAPGTPAAEAARVGIQRIRSAMNQQEGRPAGKGGFVFGPVADAWTVLFGWADPVVASIVFLGLWGAGFLALAAWRLAGASGARGGARSGRHWPSLAGAAAAVLLGLSVLAGGTAWGAARVADLRVAVVTRQDAPLYDDIASVDRALSLPDGLEVRFLESRGGLVHVRLSSGREGWVPEVALGVP